MTNTEMHKTAFIKRKLKLNINNENLSLKEGKVEMHVYT